MARPKKDSTVENNEEPGSLNAKSKALELALASIKKQYGSESIASGLPNGVEFYSSQSIGLDNALGGGWAKGRIIEIFGPESSGKTTLTLHLIAEVQKNGGTAAFIDAEHALDPLYATNLGVDMGSLILSQPDHGEQAMNIVDTLASSKAVDLIVVDSVAALVPQKELEGEIGDSHMGLQARLMGQSLRVLTGKSQKNDVTIVFINQLRMKIGIMFGNPETTPGGNALKFYSSQRVDIRRIGGVKDGDQLVGNRTKIKVIKNKVGRPFQEHELTINYGQGIDIYDDLLTAAVEKEIIVKSGAWYSYKEENIGQGAKQIIELFKTNKEFYEEIFELVQTHR